MGKLLIVRWGQISCNHIVLFLFRSSKWFFNFQGRDSNYMEKVRKFVFALKKKCWETYASLNEIVFFNSWRSIEIFFFFSQNSEIWDNLIYSVMHVFFKKLYRSQKWLNIFLFVKWAFLLKFIDTNYFLNWPLWWCHLTTSFFRLASSLILIFKKFSSYVVIKTTLN